MIPQDIHKRAEKLRNLINEYRYEYHVNNNSTMSEEAADSLKHELSELEKKYPELITPDSPTQRVAGEPLAAFRSVAHKYRMLSLNDVFDEAEMLAWENRIQKLSPESKLEYFADIKMDGLACALIYEDGILQTAITRGNGEVGEDITTNARTLESVPLSLRNSAKHKNLLSGRTEIRGEIVMYKKDFANLNKQREKQGLPLFANPRNLAAGTVRQLDPKLVIARPLHFRSYDILRDSPDEVPTNEYCYNALAELGFLVNKKAKVLSSISEVMKFADDWQEKRNELEYNTDGLVVKLNDRKLFAKLGIVGKAPRGAVAYKYPAEQSTTILKDIFVSIGRTGAATPVAVLEPVVIAGSTVQMATLHNESEVARKDVRVGDTVIVQKAGDIIPEIVEPLVKLRTGKEKPFVMPKQCPECGTTFVKQKDTEAVWRCPNSACPARVHNQIQHFASKPALDIEGMGEKNVLLLLDSGLINDAADLYSLTRKQLLSLDRFADISATKLISSIASKKNPPLAKFIFALGIRHVGAQTAVDLAARFKTFDVFRTATLEELRDVEGVGEVVAESIVAWFGDKSHQNLLEKFKNFGVNPKDLELKSSKLEGKSFVITGSLSDMDREEAADRIRALGGTFQSSVTQTTDYLVAASDTGSSKLEKANKYGTKIINEKEFLKIIA